MAGRWPAAIALATLLQGCGSLDVGLPGNLPGPVISPAALGGDGALAVDRLGNLTLNGRVLDLPRGAERVRWGLSAVDAGALPPVWRPPHAEDGGVLIAGLAAASPLAMAGLRPLDRVLTLDDAAPEGPRELCARLAAAERVRLEVRSPDGARRRVEAEAAEDGVEDNERFYVPYLFERQASAAGESFGFGPLDLVLWFRALVERRVEAAPDFDGWGRQVQRLAARDPSRYVDRLDWGVLGNLVRWTRVTDGDEERWQLTLLWFIDLGDDEP